MVARVRKGPNQISHRVKQEMLKIITKMTFISDIIESKLFYRKKANKIWHIITDYKPPVQTETNIR